ncbi:Hypothetical protein CINCED_3A016125 [Cinara cedri]|nr:Hypothetical protein CINCED_3A016125 [Cinara cedri]
MGAFLFYTATKIDEWLPESEKPNLKALVYAFSVITFLAATQDIVVDGWALTMLKQNNVGHSSTCNGTGLALGVLIGMVGPVLLTSEDFCNKYLRFTDDTGGIITIKSFLYFWSIAFILITILIVTFKKENDFDESETKINIFQNYKLLWQILRLQNVRVLVVALLTMKIGFSATDAVSHLKLIDAGISKNNIMLIQISMYVVKFIIPLVVSKYTSGLKPMSAYMNLMPIRLLWSFTYVILIYYTPALINTNGVVDVPIYYYVILGLICTVHEILSFTMFIFTIGFFSRISDKRFGGTYMTMLTTIANFGWAVSNTIALRMIDVLTFSKCSNDVSNNCSTPDLKTVCQTNRGECVTAINGYYLEVILCVTIGFVWYYIYKGIVRDLQSMNPSNWLVNIPRPNMKRDENNIITR